MSHENTTIRQRKDNHTDKPALWIRTTVLFTMIMVAGVMVSALACYLFYRFTQNDTISRTRIQVSTFIHISHLHVRQTVSTIFSDLEFLTRQNELHAYLNSGTPGHAESLAAEYLLFAEKREIYDQIRFLDRNGREAVRINVHNGKPEIVAPENMPPEHVTNDQLQETPDRDYFKEVKDTGPGAIYISKFDLNRKNGVVERPPKPVIRFAMPVFGPHQRFLGVVVLNCLGDYLIDSMLTVSNPSAGDLMLVDSDGYWLASPNPEDEWGAVLPGGTDKRFDLRYPEAWPRIKSSAQSQFMTDQGLFSFETFSALDAAKKSRQYAITPNSRNNSLKIISFLSREAIAEHHRELKNNLITLWTVMALLTLLPSWLLASSLVRRQLSRQKLLQMATHDTLTGLYNRRCFRRILDQTMDEARRYDRCFAIFFIDLDGFKSVNDRMGHDAGDMVLRQAAKRMQKNMRSTDRLARLGGDEFCAIIHEVDSQEKAAHVAQKLISELRHPFELENGTGRIGASIGIALFPCDGRNGDSLVKSADTAMYAAKSEGKGKFRFAV